MPASPLVGILGGGQLGRMLALAGLPLGLRFRFLDPNPDSPAKDVGELILAPYDDPAALERFTVGLTAATFEFENVPARAAEFLASRVPTYPPPGALATCQDRLLEKQLFTRLEVPTNRFAPAQGAQELRTAIQSVGRPCVVKIRRMGYDGKGQVIVRTKDDEDLAIQAFGGGGTPCIVEEFVPFDREVSILVARAKDGSIAFYPLIQNIHEAGILRLSIAPLPEGGAGGGLSATPLPEGGAGGGLSATPLPEGGAGGGLSATPLPEGGAGGGLNKTTTTPLSPQHSALSPNSLTPQAHSIAQKIATAINHVGVLAVECFEKDGRLLANEIAPRVHNSGHWTIEGRGGGRGGLTSQFENHLRAVLGLPLGPTSMNACSGADHGRGGHGGPPTNHTDAGAYAMINFIGTHPPLEALAAIPGLAIHLYNKAPKPGRKIGHATLSAPTPEAAAQRAHELRKAWGL